ncbi:MAG: CehA/McbA family metallohydrolase [Candidatus Helarchaeota archaeon]
MKKFDLHIHSSCSRHKTWGIDGINTPQEIVEMAVRKGLDGIAITDHNTLQGSQKAINYVKEKGFDLFIFPGAEIRSELGDILAFGITEDIHPKRSIFETIDAIKDQGGIAVAAHPYKYNSKIGQFLEKYSSNPRFDAIEVFNANIRKTANYQAFELAETLKLPGIAGSDAHYYKNLGLGLTLLEIEDLTETHVIQAILRNKIKLSCQYTPLDNILILYFKKVGNMLKRSVKKGRKPCT